ncbi:MAG: ABC transporter permease [Flavisolibacter sp.]
MFKNYFLIAWRNLSKQKTYSLIKVGGFALSIASCLLIAMYIKNEVSYDKQWANADRIYRLIGEYSFDGKVEKDATWQPPMAKVLKEDFPEVEKAGRLMPYPSFYGAGSNQIKRIDQQQNTYEEGFTYADQEILDILQVPMVYGKRSGALIEPNSIVLTESMSKKFFASENPLGKILILNNDKKTLFKVGGVIKDFPKTSHLNYNFLLSLSGHELWPGEQSSWVASNYPVYLLLKKGADPVQFQRKLGLILKRYVVPALKNFGNVKAEQIEKHARIVAQPIADVHLHSYDIDDGIQKGDVRIVWLFGAIASFILILACINFINLSTAKSANRAKEVGLRKVVGSHRIDLVVQFLVESLLFSLLSFAIGMLLAVLTLPFFNNLSAKSLSIPWSDWWLIPLIMVASLIVGFLAGVYPSLYLSSFKPIQVLKGQMSRGSKSSVLRNGLVVFQFTISIILIISTLVIYNQTKYILNKKVGFDKDQVLLIQGTNTLNNRAEVFKEEIQKLAQVKNVSISDYLPITGTFRDGNPFWKEGKVKTEPSIAAQKWRIDRDYLKTLGIRLIAGRDFFSDANSDSASAIINKSMVDKMGVANPIGQRITNSWENFIVIGVVEDFNYESMKQEIGPVCMVLGNNKAAVMALKMGGTDVKNTISSIGSVWKKFAPDQPFRYTFLDESFGEMYADVQRTSRIFTSFAIFAIVIACLGLFALSAFMAEQRTKEIGIRKILGASINSITVMLSKDFIKLIVLAILIASPIGWWAMTKWLQDFAYRIKIGWTFFLVAAGLALIIAIVTVSFQAVKAAVANPVKSLRTE